MMKILSAKIEREYLTWLSIWKEWDGKEIFAHPDYLNLYDDYSDAMCAVIKYGDKTVLYPFCLRDLSADFSLRPPCNDIISPYGYGGLYLIGEGDFNGIIEEFYLKFSEWAVSKNVISEFIRFDLFNESRDRYNGDIIHNNDNVVCDLTKGKETLWKEFKAKVRNNVRKASSNKIELILDYNGERIDDFLKVYYGTMDRRLAQEDYYFKREFFLRIHEKLSGNFVYFFAEKDGEVISADLVLISDKRIYSFLSGTNRESFKYRPNDFIKYSIINWGVDEQKTDYVLGGGYKPLDSLFNYKKAFAPQRILPFYVGKKIYNSDLYDLLVECREKELLETSNVLDRESDFFPLYRTKCKVVK